MISALKTISPYGRAEPTFICPGVQKAGTTWLHEALKLHPDFWMPYQKEMDYLTYNAISRERYKRYFHEMMPPNKPGGKAKKWWNIFINEWELKNYTTLFGFSEGKFSGDISPDYWLMSENEIRAASKLLADTKIIIILRNPIERSWSAAKYFYEDNTGITEIERMQKVKDFCLSDYVLSRSNYTQPIKLWRKYFGSERVYITYFDNLQKDCELFISNILNFIEAPAFPHEKLSQIAVPKNSGKKLRIPDELKAELEDRFSPMIKELSSMLSNGEPCPWWLR